MSSSIRLMLAARSGGEPAAAAAAADANTIILWSLHDVTTSGKLMGFARIKSNLSNSGRYGGQKKNKMCGGHLMIGFSPITYSTFSRMSYIIQHEYVTVLFH